MTLESTANTASNVAVSTAGGKPMSYMNHDGGRRPNWCFVGLRGPFNRDIDNEEKPSQFYNDCAGMREV